MGSGYDPDLFSQFNVDKYFGAMSIGGSFAYVMFGVSCSQMVWYFRSYPRDPPLFKAFICLLWIIDTVNLCLTVFHLYYMLIWRGVGMDTLNFVLCDYWSINGVLVLTELCCALVELFFILRMWRFAEKRKWAFFAFIPYLISGAFTLRYVYGMFKTQCFPEMEVNFIWLLLSYSFKILSDGIIAGTMIWLLYHRSRGIRNQGGTMRVIRDLMYWTLSTGLILWVSTLVYLLTYALQAENLVSTAFYLSRGRIYVMTLLAVINDRKRYRAVIQRPESISLKLTGTRLAQEEDVNVSHFWKSMAQDSLEPNGNGAMDRSVRHGSLVELEQ